MSNQDERLGRIETRLDGFYESIEKIEKAIAGNGQEGLVQRVSRLERFAAFAKGAIWLLAGVGGTAGMVFAGYQALR